VTDRDGMYVVTAKGAMSFRMDYRLSGRRETIYLGNMDDRVTYSPVPADPELLDVVLAYLRIPSMSAVQLHRLPLQQCAHGLNSVRSVLERLPGRFHVSHTDLLDPFDMKQWPWRGRETAQHPTMCRSGNPPICIPLAIAMLLRIRPFHKNRPTCRFRSQASRQHYGRSIQAA
jgi:hypothetical protein